MVPLGRNKIPGKNDEWAVAKGRNDAHRAAAARVELRPSGRAAPAAPADKPAAVLVPNILQSVRSARGLLRPAGAASEATGDPEDA